MLLLISACGGGKNRAVVTVAPVTIAAGYEHSLAIKADGTLWAWGGNFYGQLGDGTDVNRFAPIQVGAANDWAAVSAGYYHSVALKADGSLWAWGNNDYCQTGDRNSGSDWYDWNCTRVPTMVGRDRDWVAVSAGYEHTAAIKADGSLWTWGNNNLGQLGDGTGGGGYDGYYNCKLVPVRVGTDRDWVMVSASDHTVAVKADGSLWAWGHSASGQLGDGTSDRYKTLPVRVGSDNDWAVVSAGLWHTMALKTDGSLWGWGDNGENQLGDGTYNNRWLAPVRVGANNDWSVLSCHLASSYTMALKADGALWGWGAFNGARDYIVLDGPPFWYALMQQIGTAVGWADLATSSNHVILLNADGEIWAFGNSNVGQVGDGTFFTQHLPVLVGTGFRVP